VLVILAFALTPLACGSDKVRSPFGPAAGGAGGEAGSPGAAGFRLDMDGGDGELDPTLGGPCEDDGQCDDGVSCTKDRCDAELGRCRFEADDTRCIDEIYCDGVERCDVRMGCVEGDVVACSDDNTCTIDACDEATRSCRHAPRDADGDGDPVQNCGGKDCDDDDPLISSESAEVCGNKRDDDCDGETDERDCRSPAHDRCADALRVTDAGTYELELTAAGFDYPNRCALEKSGYRDVVLEVTLPDGGPYDLDVSARADVGRLVLGTASTCGEGADDCAPSFVRSGAGISEEVACRHEPAQDAMACGDWEAYGCDSLTDASALEVGMDGACNRSSLVSGAPVGFCCPPPVDSMSRLLLRGVGPGKYPIYVAGDREGVVQVSVDFRDAEGEPLAGDLCEDAVPITANGAPLRLRLPGYEEDETTACSFPRPRVGDAFVAFTLDEPRDVILVAEAEKDFAIPLLSLLGASCAEERTCRRSQPGRLFERDLPAGDYRVAVSGTAADDVMVRLSTAPVTPAPQGEGCGFPLPLVSGVEQVVDLSTHEDAVNAQCLVGAPDATFTFDLASARDVLLVGRFSGGDTGAISFTNDVCDDAIVCGEGGPARAVRHRVPKGTYRAVVESSRGNPVGVSVLERQPVATVVVPFADDCDAVVTIPERGGHFTGNTKNAFPDFDGGCDVGGQDPGGAPDQLLKLSLSAPRRVIFDMSGSRYRTMLSVRNGALCPGVELPRGCAPGYRTDRSYLDLELQAGDYFIQVDGYDGDSGPWNLEVFTAPLGDP
jgi:hypothetical protein